MGFLLLEVLLNLPVGYELLLDPLPILELGAQLRFDILLGLKKKFSPLLFCGIPLHITSHILFDLPDRHVRFREGQDKIDPLNVHVIVHPDSLIVVVHKGQDALFLIISQGRSRYTRHLCDLFHTVRHRPHLPI